MLVRFHFLLSKRPQLDFVVPEGRSIVIKTWDHDAFLQEGGVFKIKGVIEQVAYYPPLQMLTIWVRE